MQRLRSLKERLTLAKYELKQNADRPARGMAGRPNRPPRGLEARGPDTERRQACGKPLDDSPLPGPRGALWAGSVDRSQHIQGRGPGYDAAAESLLGGVSCPYDLSKERIGLRATGWRHAQGHVALTQRSPRSRAGLGRQRRKSSHCPDLVVWALAPNMALSGCHAAALRLHPLAPRPAKWYLRSQAGPA